MASDARVVSRTDLLVARKHAERELRHEDLSRVPAPIRESLIDVSAGYFAVRNIGLSSEQSLEAALGVFWKSEATPRTVSCFDELLKQIAKNPDDASAVLGGALSYLSSSGEGFRVKIGDVWYGRRLVSRPQIFGLDEELAVLSKSVNHLFAYNPISASNPLRDVLSQGILLYGPPGTGKSSLCKYAIAEGRDWASATGISFRSETFRASDYSKWVGESAQALRRKFLQIADPSGVGVLVFDDVDMVVASRDDTSASHGSLQVTSEAMQFMSGVGEEFLGNYLVIGTTNRTDLIDAAMRRRFQRLLLIPGYSSREQYTRYVDWRMPWADDAVRSLVVDEGFDKGYSPAGMHSLCAHIGSERFGVLSAQQLKDPFAHANELGVSCVKKLLSSYCPA